MKHVLLLLPLLFATPALAQTVNQTTPAFAQGDDIAALEKTYGGYVTGCFTAHSDKAMDQLVRQQTCEAEVTKIDTYYRGRPSPSAHERNMYLMHRGFLLLESAGAMTNQDKVRSRRVCTQTEASYLEFTRIVDAASPASYTPSFASLRESVGKAATLCRSEFGVPEGAPPLPQ